MIESIKQYALSYEFISMLALFTYWIPLLVCATVYSLRFVGMYKRDLKGCKEKYYTPSLTIGVIVWYLVVTLAPAVNMLAMVFDCGSSVFEWLGKTLNIPLVRKIEGK